MTKCDESIIFLSVSYNRKESFSKGMLPSRWKGSLTGVTGWWHSSIHVSVHSTIYLLLPFSCFLLKPFGMWTDWFIGWRDAVAEGLIALLSNRYRFRRTTSRIDWWPPWRQTFSSVSRCCRWLEATWSESSRSLLLCQPTLTTGHDSIDVLCLVREKETLQQRKIQ